MKKIWQKSLASMVSAALCLTAFVGCLTVNAATVHTGTIKSNGVAVATTATEAKLDVAVSVSNVTPGIAYTGLKATTEFGTLKGVEIKSGKVKVEELSTDGVTSIPAIDENGSFIIAAIDTLNGANDYVLTLTFAKNASVELVEGAKYPVTITYLGSKDVGAANWNEDPIGFNVEVKDITVTAATAQELQLSAFSYNHKATQLNYHYEYSDAFINEIKYAKGKNRVLEVVFILDGNEYSFELAPKTYGDYGITGLTLNDITKDMILSVRLTYVDNNVTKVINTNSYTVNVASMIKDSYDAGTITDSSELAIAEAYLNLNNLMSTSTNAQVDATFTEASTHTDYVTTYNQATYNITSTTLSYQYTHNTSFVNMIKAGKDKGRTVSTVILLGGKEYVFEMSSVKTYGPYEIFGFTTADLNSEITLSMRLEYVENGVNVVYNSDPVTITIADEIAKDTTTDLAVAYSTYNQLIK